jgi:cellulose synthase/poly-beta-1,6-N-acetylglucosamine synthase-like glycosyltransferase
MEILFWVGAFGVTYSYFLYPLLLLLLPRRRRTRTMAAEFPTLTVIIAVHNEASRLSTKLENTLACGYPGRCEVIVASDASTDDTDLIATSFADRGVRLVRSPVRRGKEYAQVLAIAQARGEILVFTDVATRLEEEGLREIVRPFASLAVGAVSSEDRFLHADGTPAGEGAYVRYEMALRRREAAVGGLVGLSGSFFAARRSICAEWDTGSPSDFNTAFNCVRRGMVAVVAPRALGYYRDVGGGREYRRKYRTVLRGMASLWRHPEVLNPFRYGLFAWQVWSHKVMRWAVPWFLPVLLAGSLGADGLLYEIALAAQAAFYALVAVGLLSPRLRSLGPVRIAWFFMEVNAAIIHAGVAFLMGARITLWEPSKR